MNASPSNLTVRSPLYRIARRAVICGGLALILANLLFAQSSSRAKKLTGPRALGLIEITPGGKVTLLPVVIMIDGEFYDASAYKAAPVPLALYTDTVYEGVKTGVSQGLFTVTTAQHGANTWRGQGKWQSAADIAAVAKKKTSAAKAAQPKVDTDGPPVLRRAGSAEPVPSPAAAPASTPGAQSTEEAPDDPNGPPVLKRPPDQSPSATTAPTATPAASTPTPATSAPSTPAPPTVTQAGTQASAVPAPAPQTPPPAASDPNVPTLRRGKTAAMKEEAREAALPPDEPAGVSKTSAAGEAPAVAPTAAATSNGIQLIPAISDAAGPDPRPYAYNMKPEEESKFRNKMLALAAVEVHARAKDLGLGPATSIPVSAHPATHASSTAAASHASKAAKPPEPNFDDVQMRVFDLSNNNEPVLVLTANARLPKSVKGSGTDVQYVVTLVAREDIYGDLHKVFSNVTDTQHLDVSPRMDFIDAVDADGDGRGELLFQQVSDSGKAFVVYRVIGDQLWALFQGKLG
jgi:hypothetical protein